MTVTPRRNWLRRLIGEEKADAVRSDLQQAAAAADEAGLERKALKAVPEEEQQAPAETAPETPAPAVETPAAEPPAGDPVQEASRKLAEQVFESIQGDPAQLSVETLAAVIAENLQPPAEEPAPAEVPAEAPAETPAPAVVPPDDDEMQQDKALSADAQTKALEFIYKVVGDQGEIAGAVAELSDEVQTVKAILPVVEQLGRDIADMREQMKLRPRSSESEENILETAGKGKAADAARKVEAEIKEGLQSAGKVLGVKVKS